MRECLSHRAGEEACKVAGLSHGWDPTSIQQAADRGEGLTARQHDSTVEFASVNDRIRP